MIVILEKL